MLYTRKGDSGTTKLFGSGERISKGADVVELLGALDEANSFLGFVKVKAAGVSWSVNGEAPQALVNEIQNVLFVAQAECAGSPKKMKKANVARIEKFTDAIEKQLPPIKTFFISGGTELSSLFDIARTLIRRVERLAVNATEKRMAKAPNKRKNENLLAFLNRLSSLLYALARLANLRAGAIEKAPWYN